MFADLLKELKSKLMSDDFDDLYQRVYTMCANENPRFDSSKFWNAVYKDDTQKHTN